MDLDHALIDRILSEKLVFEFAAAKQEPLQDQVESLIAPLFVKASLERPEECVAYHSRVLQRSFK